MIYTTKRFRYKQLIVGAALWLWVCSGLAQSGNSWQWYQRKEPAPPKWSLELKYGEFEAELEDFDRFYGDDNNHTAIAVAYKLLRAVEVGLEYGQVQARGVGNLPINGGTGGEVTFTLKPTHLYLLIRGIWGEDQIGVPYIGGGITEVNYEQEILNQPSRSGKAKGSHTRYGLQFLLDGTDTSLAREMQSDYSVNNTYLFIEKQSFDADVDGIELGGETVFVGFLFEF